VRLDRGKLDVHYQLDLQIRQGKIRQIRFTLPAAVGRKIQIVPLDSCTLGNHVASASRVLKRV
jgi:hypothetical protein